ncbi:7782_t:CDS:2 [Funneliformis mosseae]|uniref:7782_t:CDS:1 n=1 Tax=Funneliformis mosseae TaxID=27381 RepID=A0A9N8ZWR7_FUNMO|nr:7782_t:CDS:2 [Funneliformis mosseae]
MPQNINELTKFLVEEWDAVPQSTVNNLVMSMKTRCEMVLEKNGDRIS